MSAVAGCHWVSATSTPDASLPRRTFGTVADGGTVSVTFTSRAGPAASPWTDIVAGGPAPTSLAMAGGTLPGGTTYFGPDVVYGGLAIVAIPGAVVATDLETGTERWRATGTDSLATALMATDGTYLCGFGETTSFLTCLAMDDGRPLFTAAGLTTFLSGATADNATELVFRRDMLYVRATAAGATVVAGLDLDGGVQRFSVPADAAWRSIVFAGGDLLVVRAASACGGVAGCLDALDPATGAVLVSHTGSSPLRYLLTTEGEAVYVPSGATGTPVAYSISSRTFREAPEWSGLGGYGGLTEPLSDGTALAFGPGQRVRYDVATRSVISVTPAQSEMRYRAHPNVLMVWVPGSGPSGFDLGSGTAPAWAFDFESWGFEAGGAYRAIP
jgi:hypothetical protein